MNDDLLALYAELKAIDARLHGALDRLKTLLPPQEGAGSRVQGAGSKEPAPPCTLHSAPCTDPDRAPVYKAGDKLIPRADLLRAVQADLERAVNLGLPVDAALKDAIEGQTNASLYGAGIELRHRLRAHEALTGSNEPKPPALDLAVDAEPGMSAMARGL